MSITKLPNDRWRAQVYDPRTKRNVSVPKIIGGPKSYGTKREAKAAREKARAVLGAGERVEVTIATFYERWTTDPLFRAPKQSTNIHNRDRAKKFCETHATLPISVLGTDRGDQLVSAWLAGGNKNSEVPALRKMVNDAMSVRGGRLLSRNPFAGLGIAKTKGNRDVDPPTEDTVWALIRAARELCPPSFACWLQVACFTGMRSAELDALKWENVDLETGRIHVVQQFSVVSSSFTTPKNGKRRVVAITPPAREALLAVPAEPGARFVFLNSRRDHWTHSSRQRHWQGVRESVGFDGSLYLATRHFAGSYMTNDLGLPAEDVAIMLGHEDGGRLVRLLYGHRDRSMALQRVANAYESRGNVRPLGIRRDAG